MNFPSRKDPVRMAMIGGGPGAFIGPIHRIAAELDGHVRLVAGAFSSDAAKSAEAGSTYGVAADRTYGDWNNLLEAESCRQDGAEFVAIVTPNHLHLPVALAALESGFHVFSDKPATATLAEALRLRDAVMHGDRHYGLTYTYSGYPLVRQARAMIAEGAIGSIRKVIVEYVQGWLAEPIEQAGSKQAAWRVDPAKSGAGGCIGDIGVHAFHLAEFVVGQPVVSISADLATIVSGRTLDDDCTVLMRFGSGARAILIASQVCIGELNGLRLRVYGDKGTLDWRQEDPNSLIWHQSDDVTQILRTGTAAIGSSGAQATRVPGGHPEGYLEAFANLYRDFAARIRGTDPSELLPGIEDGVRSMAFIETAVRASHRCEGWVELDGGAAKS